MSTSRSLLVEAATSPGPHNFNNVESLLQDIAQKDEDKPPLPLQKTPPQPPARSFTTAGAPEPVAPEGEAQMRARVAELELMLKNKKTKQVNFRVSEELHKRFTIQAKIAGLQVQEAGIEALELWLAQLNTEGSATL